MAKINLAEHERHKMFVDGWREFGERLGWNLYLIDVKHNKPAIGHFTRHEDATRDDGKVAISENIRQDIERTWREAEQASVTPIKVAG